MASDLTIEEANDRLATIDQLPEVGPELVAEADELLDIVLESDDPDERSNAITIYKETANRAVSWNP